MVCLQLNYRLQLLLYWLELLINFQQTCALQNVTAVIVPWWLRYNDDSALTAGGVHNLVNLCQLFLTTHWVALGTMCCSDSVTSALCISRWAQIERDSALPESICSTVSEPYTKPTTSWRPEPCITVPTEPRKLIRKWKPPKRHTMLLSAAAFEISIAFNHKGWSKVIQAAGMFSFLAL